MIDSQLRLSIKNDTYLQNWEERDFIILFLFFNNSIV